MPIEQPFVSCGLTNCFNLRTLVERFVTMHASFPIFVLVGIFFFLSLSAHYCLLFFTTRNPHAQVTFSVFYLVRLTQAR